MPPTDTTAQGPLVSIIVPMADDANHGPLRIASAHAQTWRHTQIVAVDGLGNLVSDSPIPALGGHLGASVAAGIRASKGVYVSLLLPGSVYEPEKISRQLEFMERMELQHAVLFCDHVERGGGVTGTRVNLPYTDPAFFGQRMLRGFALQFSSLLFPRRTIVDLLLPGRGAIESALFGYCVRLSRATPFVGLAEPLVIVTGLPQPRGAPHQWRSVHAGVLKDYLAGCGERGLDARTFSTLGEAAGARMGEGLALSMLDVVWSAVRLLPSSPDKLVAVRSFATPILQIAFRQLPRRVRSFLRPASDVSLIGQERRLDFAGIYRGNGFVGTESLSGSGSTIFQTRIIRRDIPPLLRRFGVRRMLDIPCGDFHWMRELDLDGIHYTGADVVPEMVQANQRQYGSAARAFATADLISGPLPHADLVFCRDCLVHLPLVDALAAVETIRRSGCKWLLATTFSETHVNRELDSDGWRPLNLTMPPFGLPQPRVLIVEKCTEAGGRAGDKALGLWHVADLPAMVGHSN